MTAVSIGVFPILLFFGGFSLPLGLPPLPEDPMLSRVAPEECLGYVSWAGTATPDSKSTNQTEQLLAEPEVQALLAAIDGAITKAIARNAGIGGGNAEIAKEIYPLAKTLLTRPAAIFLSKIEISPQGPPNAQGGAIFNLAEKTASVATTLESLEKLVPPESVEKIAIAGASFHQIKLAPMPPVTWGIRGKYLIVGVGEGAVEGMLKRAKAEPPGVAGCDSQATARRPPIDPDLCERQADYGPVRALGRAEGQTGPRCHGAGKRGLPGHGHGAGRQGQHHPHARGDRRPAARCLQPCRGKTADGGRPGPHPPRCNACRRRPAQCKRRVGIAIGTT